jgi:tetratricopeptide (TPR) repeat protein
MKVGQMTSKAMLVKSVQGALRRNDRDAAASLCETLCEQFSTDASAWRLASEVATLAGKNNVALAFIDRAIALAPDSGALLLMKAQCLATAADFDSAQLVAQQIEAVASADPRLLSSLGAFLSRLGLHTDALRVLKAAVAVDPNDAASQYNLGAVLRFLGDFAAAEVALDHAVSLQPVNGEAWYLRSQLRIHTTKNNHCAEMSHQLAKTARSWQDEVHLRFALAKELEDQGELPRAFVEIQRAGQVRRLHMKYDVDADIEVIDAIIDVFNHDFFKTVAAGHSHQSPIFILGMPRTGSTLVERILDSHSHITSAGELNDFPQSLMAGLPTPVTNGLSRRELVCATKKIDFAALGERYFARVFQKTRGANRFVDKAPMNFLYCGLIHKALPHARIIHTCRNPMDSCFAMFKQLFNRAYPFSYDLDDLGKYYVAYHRLMQHWRRAIPQGMYDLSYEKLVRSPRHAIGELLQFCALPWEEACMQFDKSPSPSTTASAAQVRRKIYNSSIGKWKSIEPQLHPIYDRLKAGGVDPDNGLF